MSQKLRNRVIFLALILLIGQLTLVVHATVHDAELSCQLCLSQTHSSKAIPTVKLAIPSVKANDSLIVISNHQNTYPPVHKAYFQRAPPLTPDI